jgi:hypothetical protein
MSKRNKIPKGWLSSNTKWIVPKKKKPIAYSATATSKLIGLLSQEYETIQDVYNAINFNTEAKKVLQAYIDKGYANEIAKEWFKY